MLMRMKLSGFGETAKCNHLVKEEMSFIIGMGDGLITTLFKAGSKSNVIAANAVIPTQDVSPLILKPFLC